VAVDAQPAFSGYVESQGLGASMQQTMAELPGYFTLGLSRRQRSAARLQGVAQYLAHGSDARLLVGR
jgi:hypothetical protein